MKISVFNFLIIIFALSGFSTFAQPSSSALELWENYSQFKEESITHRRFQHKDIAPLIMNLKRNDEFNVQKVGESIEGRDIFLISVGEGDIDVFLWSQMHGDESTATMALFDIFNFISSEEFKAEKEELFGNLKLHFLPMLNPDGAQVFQRRNALGIDVNRDALRLQSPEGKILKRIRDSLDADFGFNLHDQSRYYNAEATDKPATISFLAPAFNYEKDVNEVRGNAMKLIVSMNRDLQHFIPGQVAKYNDDFEPRAFGDNIQKWGTSAILIESGGYLNDPDKQEIRKLNFVAILSALQSISNGDYKNESIEDYHKIPENDSKLFDLKLKGLQYELMGQNYILDLGINHQEISNGKQGYYYRSQIADQGDLSTNYGYSTHDLSGYKITFGKIHPQTYNSLKDLEKLDFRELLLNGYSYIKIRNFSGSDNHTMFPLQVVGENFKKPARLNVGSNPTFFLSKGEKLRYAVINGFLVDLEDYDPSAVKNALIFR
jgi:hypothetical protein